MKTKTQSLLKRQTGIKIAKIKIRNRKTVCVIVIIIKKCMLKFLGLKKQHTLFVLFGQ